MSIGAMMGRWLVPAVMCLVCSIMGTMSSAQVRTPCDETISKFCKEVIPGNGRIVKCLNDQRDDQSIACKDWIEDQQKGMQELMGACAEDITRWCRNTATDKVSVYYCLLDNYISLRLDCRSRLGEVRDRLK